MALWSKEKEYAWDGDWQGPQHGEYVIIENRREMEPGEVIDLLRRYQELLEQVSRANDE